MYLRLLPLLVASVALLSQAAAPSQWEWIYPLPHRQSWLGLAAGTNGFVGLTEGYGGRQIYHSTDGAQWQLAQVPLNNGLKKVEFLNGQYIAVGSAILSSPDGNDWQIRSPSDAGGSLFDIAYGNGAYVAVGYNSVALWAKDLKNWSPLQFPPTYSLLSIEFGNGFFLAVATSGKIYKSVDGRIWNENPWPEALGLMSSDWQTFDSGLAFNNGTFVLTGRGGCAISSDGVNWTVVSQARYRAVGSIGSGFVASTGNDLAVSTDGATWQTVVSLPASLGTPFYAAAKFGDRWLAGGYGGLLYTSTNSVDWQPLVNPIEFSHSKIAFANGSFIRYGAGPGHILSSDGATWSTNANAPALTTLAGGNGIWAGITESNTVAFSSNGTDWQQSNLPAAPYGNLIFGKGSFVCAAEGGVVVSTDGKIWDAISIPNIRSLRLIGFQNGIFAAFSNANEPITSADGRHWTVHSARPDLAAQFFSAGNGRFIGIGTAGMGYGQVIWSTDGVNWQKQILSSGSTYSYTGLEYGDGYFVMIDGSGEIYYSIDGLSWQGGRQAAQPFTGAAFGNGSWIVVGGDSVLRSTAPLAAKSVATLQFTQTDFSSWSLVVTGSPGERWQIQSAAGINAEWTPLQIVQIPAVGKITVPLALNQRTALFRAVIVP